MKESMMNKAKKFWATHKYKIMGVLTLAGIGTYAYCKYRQSQPSDEEIEKAVTTTTADLENMVEEVESKFDRRQKDPAYQLENGGWITDDYELGPFKSDDGKEINCVEMLINDLPIGNLGVFADDISKKLDEMYPNHGPLTDVSMIVDLRSDPTFESKSHQDIRKEEPAA